MIRTLMVLTSLLATIWTAAPALALTPMAPAAVKYVCDPVFVPIQVYMHVDLNFVIGKSIGITYTYKKPDGGLRTDVVPTKGDLIWRADRRDFHGCTGPLCVPNEGDRTTIKVTRGRLGIDREIEVDEDFISAGFIDGGGLNRHVLTCRLPIR